MSGLAIKHLAWKEFRQLTPILLCMSLVILVLVICKWTGFIDFYGSNPIATNWEWIWAACLITCSLLGLTIGVSLFSVEKEHRTAELLSNFPIPPNALAAGKLLPGFLYAFAFSALVMVGLFVFLEIPIHGFHDKQAIQKLLAAVALIVLPTLGAFAWGAFFSILTHRTLFSVILATLVNSFLVQITRSPNMASGETMAEALLGAYCNHWILHSLITFAVLVINFSLARRWSRQTTGPTKLALNATGRNQRKRFIGKWFQIPLFKLTWQGLRQSKWTLAASFIAIVGGCIFFALNVSVRGTFRYAEQVNSTAFILAAPVFGLIGLCVFWGDQSKKSFLFFQQHAEYGRQIWLARILFWIPVFLIGFLAVTLAGFIDSGSFLLDHYSNRRFELRYDDHILLLPNIVPWLCVCLGCFAIGQAVSMFIRSRILAPLFAMIFAFLFSAWSYFVFYIYVGYWWTILPLALSMFLATFLQARSWISQTNPIRSRLMNTGIIGITFLATLVGIFVYRAYEVPQIATPLVFPATVRTDLQSFIENEDDLWRKWTENPQQAYVYEDLLEQGRQNRDKIAQAIKDAKRLEIFTNENSAGEENDLKSIVEIDDEPLEQFISANQTSIETLLSIENPWTIVPTLANDRFQDFRPRLRNLLVGYAKFELENGNLEASLKSLKQFSVLVTVVHFRAKAVDLSPLYQLWEQWLEHPDQTAELLAKGQTLHPDPAGPSGEYAFFGIQEASSKALKKHFKTEPILPIPSERTRARRINEIIALSNTRSQRVLKELRSKNRLTLFSRNDFFEPRLSGSTEAKWGIDIYSQSPYWNWRSTRSEMLRTKAKILLHQKEFGELPSVETVDTEFDYRPNGLDGALYVGNSEGPPILLVKKNTPFILSFANQVENRTSNYPPRFFQFEKWKGIPRPNEESFWQVELKDGTIIRSFLEPQFDWGTSLEPQNLENSEPQYRIRVLDTDLDIFFQASELVKATPSSELGEGPVTYLLYGGPQSYQLVTIPEN